MFTRFMQCLDSIYLVWGKRQGNTMCVTVKYSPRRFRRFSEKQQWKAIFKWGRAFEEASNDFRKDIIINMKYCLEGIEDSDLQSILMHLDEDMDVHSFLKVLIPFEQKKEPPKKDHTFLIHHLDNRLPREKPLPIIAVLDCLRSSYNVGAIIRTAECFGIEELWTIGYTPRDGRVVRTSLNTMDNVVMQHFDNVETAIEQLRKDKYTLCGLETSDQAECL
ncbi:hypothetical protein OAB57_02575, partial [Bacteriovoracaceae bacterium]|nr:hypothetical protein [Bacteriovoracaceae bacterium]